MFKAYLIVSVVLLVFSIFGVFQVRYQVDLVNKSLNIIYDDINLISEEIEVLDAELSYISRPDRIEHLAHSYLKMRAIDVDQVMGDICSGYTVLANKT